MKKFRHIKIPKAGERIDVDGDRLIVPDNPIIPFIEGDGIGPDIWKATKSVIDNAVIKAYNSKRKINWMEIYAGRKAVKIYGKNQWLPKETVDAIKEYQVAIKGPLTTPVSGGIRSINVALRQKLDLFACIRPVKYFSGVPSPVKKPGNLDVVIFRENTEDVYTGIEFKANSKDAKEVIGFISQKFKKNISPGSGIGIKTISEFASIRLVKKAIEYAIENKRKTVTLVHKGNIMKYTDGSFKDWGYHAARKFFPDITITEEELDRKYKGKIPSGKILINDRIIDSMFQQLLFRPGDFEILATPNMIGDYLSDACAAQIGGLGLAPGANMSYSICVFEASHGSAPKYAGMDKINPTSLILSGVLMLRYIGWSEAAVIIENAIKKTIKSKYVTYDLANRMSGVKSVKCSAYAGRIVKNL
ncbi:MAG: isocitrate dehydrogenase (NADP(+)) [Melioribacteraceae bacterium]|nr:isocitrate dehydrogenase (NADP(+)) [Melioribacteraceae bacterium]